MNSKTSHTPRKRFGQNFLRDHGIIEKIVRAINPRPSDLLVEIGPGQGAITMPLLEKCHQLHVIEVDRDLVLQLKSLQLDHPHLTVHNADALEFDFSTLANFPTSSNTERPDTKLRIVGNLPYNISTPLIFHLLDHGYNIADMHFMLQKEVVDRLASLPGVKSYGRLSVMAQYFCEVQPLFTVPPQCFFPPPKVDSAIVRLVPRQNPEVTALDLSLLRQLVNHCFQQRRKTLRNSLKRWFADAENPLLRIEQLNLTELALDLNARPDTISVNQYVGLANQLAQLSTTLPTSQI